LCPLGAAQIGSEDSPRVQEPEESSVAVASARPGITPEDAKARIAELEAASEVDEPLLELYRQLVQRLEAEVADTTRAEAFRQAVDIAPVETARVREELASTKENPPEPLTEPPDGSVEELQQILAQTQATLAALNAQRSDLDRLISEEEARTVQEQLVAARGSLSVVQAELDTSSPPDPDAPEPARIAYEILRARKSARAAEIAMLDQELLSRPARIELLEARRETALWSIAQAEARETQLQDRLSEARRAEASRAAFEADRVKQDARSKHEVLQAAAASIAEVTDDTQTVLPKTDSVRVRREITDRLLSRTEGDYELTTRSFDLGIGRERGMVLVELRRSLPDTSALRRSAAARSTEIASARLQLFDVERELESLATPERVADETLEDADTTGVDRDKLRAELIELLTTKRTSLDLLQDTLSNHLTELVNLDVQERGLIDRTEELKAILAERLIWIPNAQPVGPTSFRRLRISFEWLFSQDPWSEAGTVLGRDFRLRRPRHLIAALVLLALLLLRSRLSTRLQELAHQVGRVSDDRILLTVEATVRQVLGTLPLPALLIFVGWRLRAAAGPGEIAALAIGQGLVVAFVLAFALQLIYDLCRRHGVAHAHFHWSERTTRLLRRHLLWFVPVALSSTFVVGLSQSLSDTDVRHGLGRLGFISLMLATTSLAYFLLHPKRGLFVVRNTTHTSVWMRRSRPVWMPLGMFVPLSLGGMAAAGYYYASLQLEERLNETLLILAGGVFVHSFALRWLKISQRRLALKVALERRAALAKKSEADEAESLATDSMIDALGEIDVAEIREQTQDLVRVSVGILVVVAVWFAWIGVLPALSILDKVELWPHSVMVDGNLKERWITLANLGLSLLTVAITITAARNMPGFLEIAVLQRLPLDQGVRYATRTLVLYTIVTTGIVLAFNAIGIGWSSVQWLVAALTVGLAFGLQEIFANFVSGLIILLERPVRVGDTVTVGEVSGVVTRIRMRATTITDWKRRELVVPNKSFITGELINWSLSDPILRMEFIVGIAYGSDTVLAHKTMLSVAREHPMVLDMPESNVFFVGFGDNSLNFEVRVFVNEPTNVGRSRIVHDLHMAIDLACREKNITIAFPQRDLHIKTSDVTWRVALEPGTSLPAGSPPSEP
jgi:potassium efflux system protein